MLVIELGERTAPVKTSLPRSLPSLAFGYGRILKRDFGNIPLQPMGRASGGSAKDLREQWEQASEEDLAHGHTGYYTFQVPLPSLPIKEVTGHQQWWKKN